MTTVQTADVDGRNYVGGNQPGFRHVNSSGVQSLIKSNLSAIVDPGVTDDSGAGYSVGSTWINAVLDKVWTCVDASSLSAAWKDISQTTPVGGSNQQLLYNNSGTIAGVPGSTWDGTKLQFSSGPINLSGVNLEFTDTALSRTSSDVLEINNRTLGQYRDLKVRHLIPSGDIYPNAGDRVRIDFYSGDKVVLAKLITSGEEYCVFDHNIGLKLYSWCRVGWGTVTAGHTPDTTFGRESAGLLNILDYSTGTYRDLKIRNLYLDSTGGYVSNGAYTLSLSGGNTIIQIGASGLYSSDSTKTCGLIGLRWANVYTTDINCDQRLQTDASLTSDETRLTVYDVNSGLMQRVKVGANGTGPGGVGRALWIANS